MVWIYHILLIHLQLDGQLRRFHFFIIMKPAALNIAVVLGFV